MGAEAVEHRVVGPPGCGKTTYLSRQCLRAAGQYGGEGIAIASLTRAAAREIASRSTGVPPANIGTLHAHAYRRLDRPALAETWEAVKDWNKRVGEQWRLTHRSVANPESATPDEIASYESGGDELLAAIGVMRSKMVDPRLWRHQLQGFWKTWGEWKEETTRLDFMDLIEKGIEDVESLGVDVIMLDEAQDMSALEMKLARQWGAQAKQIVVVGDPDQNLYEWRGSDPAAFYAAEAASTRTLAQSYRVPRAVHQRAVEWIESTPGRVPVEYEPRDEEGLVERHEMACFKDGPGMCRLVESLAADGSTVMVLASCGYMLGPVIGALRDAAVPFWNPYRETQGAWNPLRGGERLLSLLRPDHATWGDEARLWTWDEVWRWVEPLVAKGVMIRGGKTRFEGKAKMRGRFDTDEDRIVRGIMDVLGEFEPEHRDAVFGMDIDWWYAHLAASWRQRQRYPWHIAQVHGGQALREEPKVVVGTIHSVKGGEADKVVLMPDLSRAAIEGWMGNQRAPIIRMFYVGMTRARMELHIVGQAGPDAVSL